MDNCLLGNSELSLLFVWKSWRSVSGLVGWEAPVGGRNEHPLYTKLGSWVANFSTQISMETTESTPQAGTVCLPASTCMVQTALFKVDVPCHGANSTCWMTPSKDSGRLTIQGGKDVKKWMLGRELWTWGPKKKGDSGFGNHDFYVSCFFCLILFVSVGCTYIRRSTLQMLVLIQESCGIWPSLHTCFSVVCLVPPLQWQVELRYML